MLLGLAWYNDEGRSVRRGEIIGVFLTPETLEIGDIAGSRLNVKFNLEGVRNGDDVRGGVAVGVESRSDED